MTIPEQKRDLSQMLLELDGGGRDHWTLQGIIPEVKLEEMAALDVVVSAPAQVDLTLAKEKKLWRVQGELATTVMLPCSRCLNNYTLSLAVTVDRLFSTGEDPAKVCGQTEMEEDIVYLDHGAFSPLRFAEEELILLLPMFPLCHQGCLGLCQYCGADRNEDLCHCPAKEKDNPFSALGNMKLN